MTTDYDIYGQGIVCAGIALPVTGICCGDDRENRLDMAAGGVCSSLCTEVVIWK